MNTDYITAAVFVIVPLVPVFTVSFTNELHRVIINSSHQACVLTLKTYRTCVDSLIVAVTDINSNIKKNTWTHVNILQGTKWHSFWINDKRA